MIDPRSLRPAGPAAPRAMLAAVHRAVAELRRGEPVVLIGSDGRAALALPAEMASGPALARLRADGGRLFLALTAQRAAALGGFGSGEGPVALPLAPDAQPDEIVALADPTRIAQRHEPGRPIGPVEVAPAALSEAGIQLMRIARLLPAALIAPLPDHSGAALATARNLLAVQVEAVAAHGPVGPAALQRVAEARVPLAGAEDSRVIAFRPEDGGTEHLAIVIGAFDPAQPVLTRIHSECLTGDLLGSLRCDCGDQLKGAIAAIGAAGGGVLLYLAQEGRGIGLVNKLRAYALQDQGFDTVDANVRLGFADDERSFAIAARMLRALSQDRVRLLTNNPRKVAGLEAEGIDVTERIPLRMPPGEHNRRYLETKRDRSGHQL
ncbi:MAG TPA: GTP cyclohydrolase II [Alphaproteobacteria bacterium]